MELTEILNGETETSEASPSEEAAPAVTEQPSEPTQEAKSEEAEKSPEEPQEAKSEETTGLKKDELPSSKELQSQLENTQKELGAYKAKARDEKTKRQELESLKAQAEKKPLPDIFDDQKGFADGLKQELGRNQANERLNTSEFYAAREFGAEKISAYKERFIAMANEKPELAQQVMSSVSPYHTMIETLDRIDQLQEMQSPDYQEKLKAQVRAEVEAELNAESEAKALEVAGISPSLAKRGSAEVGSSTWTGPTPLTNILQ